MIISNSHYLSVKSKGRYRAFGDEPVFEFDETFHDNDGDGDERFYPNAQLTHQLISTRREEIV